MSRLSAVPLPDPDVIRARIDEIDSELNFLRRLLRLIVREQDDHTVEVTARPERFDSNTLRPLPEAGNATR